MLYLLLGLIAGIGIAAAGSHSGRIGMALITASVAGTGVFVAGYQVWIQRFAQDTNCAAQAPWWEQMVDWAGERIPFFFQANGLCSDPAWKFLGLSIAEWSLVAFTTMLALALLAASGRLATGSSDR
jgi:disulfide bond formation protein DsbB